MTNEDYLQWEPLINKIAYKYINNKYGLDIDDLKQIGAIGLMYGYDTYKEDKEASRKTYFYNCIEWRIKRELENLGRAKRFCEGTISLDAPIKNDNSDDTFIADTVPDENVNVEASILEVLTIKKYIDDINKTLKGNKRDVFMYKVFDSLSNNQIALALDLEESKVNTIFRNARIELIRQNKTIRILYLENRLNECNIWLASSWTDHIFYKDKLKELEETKKEIELLKGAIKRDNKEASKKGPILNAS
ncbi:sigma-70 family RNA polymerase sigma factor [Intestinibacter sp.]